MTSGKLEERNERTGAGRFYAENQAPKEPFDILYCAFSNNRHRSYGMLHAIFRLKF